MASPVGNAAALLHQQHAASVHHQQVQRPGGDSDGDNDGSRPGEVEQAEASGPPSGTVGHNINTTA